MRKNLHLANVPDMYYMARSDVPMLIDIVKKRPGPGPEIRFRRGEHSPAKGRGVSGNIPKP